MTENHISTLQNGCPLGAHLNNYWQKLSAAERRMCLDEQALYSLDVQTVFQETAAKIKSTQVLDAFAAPVARPSPWPG